MAEAPQVIGRIFPDAAQIGIGNGVTVNQSRVTFHGQRGLVVVRYNIAMLNGGAVAISRVGVNVNLVGVSVLAATQRVGWFDAVPGRSLVVGQELWFVDPADGSFVEMVTSLSGGTVDIAVQSSRVVVESYAPGVGAGPVATVA